MAIKLLIGLRNPGAAYAETRHNAGAWFVETLVQHYAASFKIEKKMHGELALIEVADTSCRVLLPLSFMNHSGLPVREVCQFYRIEPHEILVVHDELDLPVGSVRLKVGGGHGGHNGLRDIITQLGGTGFNRLRIGIGHPGHKTLVLDYVLGKPSKASRVAIQDAINRAVDVMPVLLTAGIAGAMNQLN